MNTKTILIRKKKAPISNSSDVKHYTFEEWYSTVQMSWQRSKTQTGTWKFQDVVFKMGMTWRAPLGNTSKPTRFTQAVPPYLIAVTARPRGVFCVKQMKQISLFPAPTLQFSSRLWFSWAVFICQNDSRYSSCEQPHVSTQFLKSLVKARLDSIPFKHLWKACLRFPLRYFLPLLAPSAQDSAQTFCKISVGCKGTQIFTKYPFAKT